jgi:hypothetical protein
MDAHGYGTKIEIYSAKPLAPPVVEELLKRIVTDIGERCLQAGAQAIGHIKCYLKTEQGYAKADIVRMKDGAYADSRLKSSITGGSLVINSILLGMHEDELERITMGSIMSLFKEHEISLISQKDGQRDHS